jgi:hypothetical protein
VKRLLRWFPYVGLVVLGLAIAVRSAGFDGLGLLSIPDPPQLALAGYEASHQAHAASGQVLSSEGTPIAEVLVMTDLAGELQWTHSDAQGRFLLEHLPEGPLSLTLVRRAQPRMSFEVEAPSTELELVYDAPVTEPPTLPEIGESELSGEVVAAIAGRGLLGYEVQLVPVLPPETLGAPIPVRALVGADRRFEFPALLHGDYNLRLLPPWAVGGSWPNMAAADLGTVFHGPATKSLTIQQESGEISGRLIGVEGDEVVGALVRVSQLDRPDRPWIPVLSSSEGLFRVLDLPPGLYSLRVEAGEDRYIEDVRVRAGETSRVDVRPIRLRSGSQ